MAASRLRHHRALFVPRVLRVQILCSVILLCLAAPPAVPTLSGQAPASVPATEQVKRRWDTEFAGPLTNLNREPNGVLVSAVAGRAPGTALDLGTGQGRNAVYLARQGWRVTGVDLSDVAIAQARANAKAQDVEIEAVVADLDQFDFGRERWDLILSFYIHAWHDRSPTDVPTRIIQALKPGGLLVMEALAKPEVPFGFATAELAKSFGRLEILRNDSVIDRADWDKDNDRHIVRFVGRKPQGPTPQPMSSEPDDTSRRVSTLQQRGRRYEGQHTTLWTPDGFDAAAARQLSSQLDRGLTRR